MPNDQNRTDSNNTPQKACLLFERAVFRNKSTNVYELCLRILDISKGFSKCNTQDEAVNRPDYSRWLFQDATILTLILAFEPLFGPFASILHMEIV